MAHKAAKLVKVTYKNKQPLITTIQEGVKSKDRVTTEFFNFFGRSPHPVKVGDSEKQEKREDLTKIEGEFELGQ